MRAFLYAGTASLLLSLWTVDDCSTAQLMGRFYEQLCAGRSKVAALREAQLRCLAGDGDAQSAAAHAHPFYWAPFILVGDTGTLQ
jgi:CHAT domain-containing protein